MADVPMAYALSGTEWNVGRVTVTTKRTWTSTEKNALSILRNVADLHGGDLVFDCPNRLVHLLILNGKDSGALFMYGKNMKDIERTVDTTGLVTRLYAVGCGRHGPLPVSNGGKPYVEDFTYSKEVRVFLPGLLRIHEPLPDAGVYEDAACGLLQADHLLCAERHGFIRSDWL